MNQLSIKRKHNLDQTECTNLAKKLLDKLVEQYGGKFKQQEGCYHYRHSSGMKAVVEPKDTTLEIAVKLNLMTRSFAPVIERQINIVLDDYIN